MCDVFETSLRSKNSGQEYMHTGTDRSCHSTVLYQFGEKEGRKDTIFNRLPLSVYASETLAIRLTRRKRFDFKA